MSDSPAIRGADRPPVQSPARVERGGPTETVLAALLRSGVAVLRGHAGAGTSWAAMDVARAWDGPVIWTRPGPFWHLGDLARTLWAGPAPAALQTSTATALVEAVLDKLRSSGALWVLDDGDDILAPPPGPATPKDPDVALLLAALEEGELADQPGAVLLVSRRTPHGLDTVLHPLPPLPLEGAAALARRDAAGFDPHWGARPAALPLIAALPPDHPLPDPERPFRELVLAVASTRLAEPDRELLLALASSPVPVQREALEATAGVEGDRARQGMLRLLNHGLARHRAGGWWMPRVLATAARDVVPDLLPGIQPDAIVQRLAAWHLRAGVDAGTDWESVDPAHHSRLGLRICAAVGDGRMPIDLVRHGHYTSVLARLGAWRALRDDLGVALQSRLGEVDPGDVAWARWQRGMAAWKLSDHEVARAELVRAVADAERSGEPVLLRELHSALARRILLDGDPAQARPHLRKALAYAHAHGDRSAECDLENQRGAIALQVGDLDAAEEAFRRSLGLAKELGDERREAARLAALGGVALYRGDLRTADEHLARAAAAARAQADASGVVHRLANLALVRSQRQDFRGALSAVGEALAAGGGLDPRSAGRLLSLRANLRRVAGDLDGAWADLERSRELVLASGDREGAGQIALARGHWLRTAGRFTEAEAACTEALESLPASREDALRASWEIEVHNAAAWSCAERISQGTGDGISQLLEVSASAKDALRRIPSEPLTARWLGAVQQVTECELLAATATGTVPRGLAMRLEDIWTRADASPERIQSGEPALRCNLAWALRLCGQREAAAAAARRAGLDAGKAGLATVRGRAMAIRRAQPIPAWNRQALLLGRLLGERE